ncbi:glutamate receptor 2.8-like [Corylus avellana]|uniref:glutamate receptor 2.8-like n=1 Tax=Corylus avellana TaxID=13451 RepID=UPI002869FEEB|nr:glutamate receptor 2.8-like [Corylus avellana]
MARVIYRSVTWGKQSDHRGGRWLDGSGGIAEPLGGAWRRVRAPIWMCEAALGRLSSGLSSVKFQSPALDLIKNEEVQAIIGPQTSAQAKFVIQLGRKARVPIISFSATSPCLSPSQNPLFIRTAQDDRAQVKAIADIVEAYGWREIVPIYEDTEYGNGLIPYLLDAFQDIDVRVPYRSVIPSSSSTREISKELNMLKQKSRTRIFIVHMTASLGSKLFVQANNAGMMKEGYGWITTAGLSSLLDPMGSKVMYSMQGVLGLRPHIPKSEKLEDFKRRLKRNLTSSKQNNKSTGLNLFGLWAYDTVWALAMAVEKAGIVRSKFLKQNASQSNVDLAALGISEMGPTLRNTIQITKFQGLSGNFHLVKRQLEPSAFEIINIIGKSERVIGYWTPQLQRGLSQELNDTGEVARPILKAKLLKQPIWPGDTTDQPTKLRIGVPVRRGFFEFLKVERHNRTDKPTVSGFSHDVFLAVLDALPFPLPYEFVPFVNKDRAYNTLLYQIKLKKYDAVVGDTTIVANRSTYVDFTLPYSESGVSMVVLMKDNERNNFWIFLKPLSLDLWLATSAAFVFTGLVIWVLEHRINGEFRGPPEQQLGTIFWFSFSTLVFAHREKVVNNWSRFVMIIWFFVVLILTQSYAASLTSMLTVQRLQPTFVDVKEIKKRGYFVGYQQDSFVKELLTKQLNFHESKLKAYITPEEYHEALSRERVAAIFDEIPYIKLFLAKHCSKYTMVGPTYKTDGFGFAFPQGSPLVPYISRAILNVTEDKDKFRGIEEKYFSSKTHCEDQGATISSHSPSLGLYSFGGLFIITAVASTSSLLVYLFKFLLSHWPTLSTSNTHESSFWCKLLAMAKHFDQKDPSSLGIEISKPRVHALACPNVIEPSPGIDHRENYSRSSNY